MLMRKWDRVTSSTSSLLSFLGATCVASGALVFFGYTWAAAQIDQDILAIRTQVAAEVFAKAEKQVLAKLNTEQTYVNKVCTDWWFNTTGVNRRPQPQRR